MPASKSNHVIISHRERSMQHDRSEYHSLLSSFKVSSIFCQYAYIVPALKNIKVPVLIGIL